MPVLPYVPSGEAWRSAVGCQLLTPTWFMRDNECEDPVPALKIQLADLIVQRVAGWAQVDAADLLRTSQPRISDLRSGRLERFSLEKLVRLVRRAEGFVELHVEWGPRFACFFEPVKTTNGDS